MEGPLSKWTNVMKGWQYRWFVLDENAGTLTYYTSKEKMMRGSRRGCVRLKGAVIGIDDEDDSTFTITVDQKTFHFQARDYDEREKWITGLEDTIVRHTVSLSGSENRHVATRAELDSKLAETDAYLQILIDQVKTLDEKINLCEDLSAQEKYCVIKVTAEAMIESVKQSIVMMQISKQTLLPELPDTNIAKVKSSSMIDISNVVPSDPMNRQPAVSLHSKVVESSFSSSDDDDDEFYDADETQSAHASPVKENSVMRFDQDDSAEQDDRPPVQVIASKDALFDELYDDVDTEDLDSLDAHSNMITYLLSQVRIGMDLTKVTLPTFILERRSLLEMYADFFAHPDLFCAIPDFKTPEERMVQVVRWYMSAFHAGRRSQVAKKPYNPILGETFLCYWDVPNMPTAKESDTSDGPIPWAGKDNVCFIAEQVSHHPPISAFYAEHFNKRISLDGYIWTKSKFLGLSIGVHMVGQAVISVIDYDEEYMITFPNGYGRSILTVPWVELGGKINVSCAKTGYTAMIEFQTKPFYGGKKHQVKGSVYSPQDKKEPLMTLSGEWNGVMWAQYSSGRNEKFVDTKAMAIMKKNVTRLDEQDDFESRQLWKHVTLHLKEKNVEKATEHKRLLEQRQRDEAKERQEKGTKWETKNFHEVGEHWVYDKPLTKRLALDQRV